MRNESNAAAVLLDAPAQQHESPTQAGPSKLATILLVEDHFDLNRTLSLRLRRYGFRVRSAFDGMEALELLQQERPDLILLDLGLPKLSGYGLLSCMHMALDPRGVPVVILTGKADAGFEERAETWGIRKVLRKPVRQKVVVDTIREILGE